MEAGDYEPRERTTEWERLIRCHSAISWRKYDLSYLYKLARYAGLRMSWRGAGQIRLYRNDICVAQWRTIR